VFPELKRVVISPGTTWTANTVGFGGVSFDLADSSRISARLGFRVLFFGGFSSTTYFRFCRFFVTNLCATNRLFRRTGRDQGREVQDNVVYVSVKCLQVSRE
jgi:hypothetical protein